MTSPFCLKFPRLFPMFLEYIKQTCLLALLPSTPVLHHALPSSALVTGPVLCGPQEPSTCCSLCSSCYSSLSFRSLSPVTASSGQLSLTFAHKLPQNQVWLLSPLNAAQFVHLTSLPSCWFYFNVHGQHSTVLWVVDGQMNSVISHSPPSTV